MQFLELLFDALCVDLSLALLFCALVDLLCVLLLLAFSDADLLPCLLEADLLSVFLLSICLLLFLGKAWLNIYFAILNLREKTLYHSICQISAAYAEYNKILGGN